MTLPTQHKACQLGKVHNKRHTTLRPNRPQESFALLMLALWGDTLHGSVVSHLPLTPTTLLIRLGCCLDLLVSGVLFLLPLCENLEIQMFGNQSPAQPVS